LGTEWSTAGVIIGTLTPLVGVPMTMIILYLKAIRQAQESHQVIGSRRMAVIEADVRRVDERLDDVERSYTTKEEWLRESLHARHQLERLMEMTTEVRTQLDNSHGVGAQLASATRAMVELTRALVELHQQSNGTSSRTGHHGHAE
jgi:hypothetical protein